MASLIKKIKKGHAYYYAVQCARVDGRPRIVWQKYLGTLEAIVKRADEARPPVPIQSVVFELGAVAGLLRIAQRLGVVELINHVVPKRDQGPSVGEYLVLAALNRAVAPCSKVAIGDWYEQTVLRRLWRFPKRAFSSQRFWDHMDMVDQEAIGTIQEGLLERIRTRFGLDPRVLLYDTTNFFTFVATSNDRSRLARRGNSKAKRYDLRQVNLALLVAGDYHVPLLHRVYPGNVPDVSFFRQISGELIGWYERLAGPCEEATLVFDKGNVSDEEMEHLVREGVHFVTALSANRMPELLTVPLDQMGPVPGILGARAFAATAQLWGKSCQAVTVYTESFFTTQLSGLTQHLVQCQNKLGQLEHRLQAWHSGPRRGKRPTLGGVRTQVREILSAQFMKELFAVQITQERGLPRLSYRLRHDELRRLTQERLGRTVLVSDHLQWTTTQIIEAYRSLTRIEEVFKDMKNVTFLRWQPAFHWTDQKIMVHGFYCVLALLLATLARKTVLQAGIKLTVPALLKELSRIQQVAVIYPPGTLACPRDHLVLTRMTPRQRKMAEALQIGDILSEG